MENSIWSVNSLFGIHKIETEYSENSIALLGKIQIPVNKQQVDLVHPAYIHAS